LKNIVDKNIIFYTLLVPLSLQGIPAQAQNANNNIVVSGQSTSWSLTSANNLENAQTLGNAILLTVQSKNKKCSIYAMVSASSTSTSTPMPASLLALQLLSIVPSMSANFNAIPLSTSNQLLFQSSNSFNLATLTYNLILGPVGYDYAPGTYSFTLLFTMTQP